MSPYEPHRLDLEARALWHLELLVCFEPEDAVAPWVPPAVRLADDFDDDEWDDGSSCTYCGGLGFDQVGDPFWDECDEHGWGPCTSCRGTGDRKHQWVF